jgi:hypothetical protein
MKGAEVQISKLVAVLKVKKVPSITTISLQQIKFINLHVPAHL